MVSRIDGPMPKEPAGRTEAAESLSLKPERQQFMNKLEQVKSEQVREHLQSLYGKISEQAERIGERLYLDDVLQYKKLVREFLDVAAKNSNQFSRQNFLDRRGRHRVYCLVKTVDRELDLLTQEFLKQETDRIGVLRRLDDIRGMLLDLMM